MDRMEMIEKLRAKANVSYEEAKEALEKTDWDMLDALVLLEKEGKVTDPQPQAEYTTQEPEDKKVYVEVNPRMKEGFSRLWDWIKMVFRKGNTNQFVVSRKGEELIAIPITVLVLLLICFKHYALIVLFVGLFLAVRYSFRGPDINRSAKVNEVMDKAAKMVQNDESDKKTE